MSTSMQGPGAGQTVRLRARVMDTAFDPQCRVIEVEQAGGGAARCFASVRQVDADSVDIGWPVGNRADGAILVELPQETEAGLWQVWVRPDQLLVTERATAET